MRILLVEDDSKLGYMIQYKLKQAGHLSEWVQHSDEAETWFAAGEFDLYILDWMLPGKTGLELCRQQRTRNDNTPILMLTARGEIEDRVNGLLTGADDYVVKPFAFEELLARITALDRRKQVQGTMNKLAVGGLLLTPDTQEAERDGVSFTLTRREFQLLEYFVRHPGTVLSRERILSYVWGNEADVTLNAVDAVIRLLRKKVDDPFPVKLIKSVHGRGYRLINPGAEPDDT
ncbi:MULTISPECIES: response regulator transcription factor [unclassified Paenibacillus]|uniref:response regulator transcription factor n=1 Tax=unclassified Paenibacillus TaxID=185978 RepID=UPI0003E20D3C|nr:MULTISPECIES: response regulator transcription factor [unclassified Paenibacillus]ETT33618.1 two-component response regulator [Paenibacillus sp. FSL R7-269]OMF95453.1 DNA-binding response regulator [Paenibacillus sp. FSL R7-0337]